MNFLGNILWLIFGGLITSIMWFFSGLMCCITIVGIPFGLQCFKLATLSLWPMGKEIVYSDNTMSFLGNVIWVIFCGVPICLTYLGFALLWAITIVGLPFSKQCLKLARLSLTPFGTEIY